MSSTCCVEVGLQRLLEVRQARPCGIGVDEIGQIEVARGDLQRGPHEAAKLAGDIVRIAAPGAQELRDMRRVVVDLPGEIGLHQDAQPVPRADVLQAAGGRPQPQVDRDRSLDRRGDLPGEARRGQYADRLAELGDDDRLAGPTIISDDVAPAASSTTSGERDP